MVYDNTGMFLPNQASVSPLAHFKTPAGLTSFLKGSLLIVILLSFVLFYYCWADYQYLRSVAASPAYQQGQSVPLELSIPPARVLASIAYLGVYLAAWIALLCWVYRANKNTHAFGGVGLDYTPGWAVGWFFIPLANFVMPCKVMQSIYKASLNPVRWREVPSRFIITAWWTLWIIGALTGRASKLIDDTTPLDRVLVLLQFEMAGIIIFSVALALTYLIVTQIADLQNGLFHYLSDNPDKHPSAGQKQIQTTTVAPVSPAQARPQPTPV